MTFESVVVALQALWANKLRSFMTVLGNIIAVASIVTVVALIQGMDSMVSGAIVGELGADTFAVRQFPVVVTPEDEDRVRNNPRITLDEAAAIRRFSPRIGAVAAQAEQNGRVVYRNQVVDNIQIRGVTEEYGEFATFDADIGRALSYVEIGRNRPVVLLGWDLADQLFGDTTPLEKVVRIEGVHFRVVGVAARRGSFFGNSQDSFAIIPLGMHTKLFGARPSLSLIVKPSSPLNIATTMDDATVALRVARRLPVSAPDDFGVYSSDTLFSLYEQATRGLFAVLVGVVALSLVVGGIVIMNIMLMVVTERTFEIGLRKAVGATRGNILSQVLTESIVLSTVGGLVGIGLGAAIANAIASVSPLPASLETWSIALGIGVTAAVGLFFGAYPASRAASLNPIDALRRE